MSAYSVFILILMLIVAPTLLGLSFVSQDSDYSISFVKGFLLLLAAFQVVATPFVINYMHLSEMINAFIPVLSSLVLICIIIFAVKIKRSKIPVKRQFVPLSNSEIIYLGLFLALVLFQLYKAVFYVYEDGDDAFYIASAQVADQSDEMYLRDPYKGEGMLLNYRYGLSPFPMWIAMMARISGLKSATVGHVFVAPVLILITYIIYYQISKVLYEDQREKRYMFLSLLCVFVIFSNYSTQTAETFLLTRSRQGKAALANIIFPFLFYMMLRMSERLNEIKLSDTLMLLITMTAAALTSLFANVLAPLMLFIFFIYAIIKKASFKSLLLLGIPVIPNLLVMLVYFIKS